MTTQSEPEGGWNGVFLPRTVLGRKSITHRQKIVWAAHGATGSLDPQKLAPYLGMTAMQVSTDLRVLRRRKLL